MRVIEDVDWNLHSPGITRLIDVSVRWLCQCPISLGKPTFLDGNQDLDERLILLRLRLARPEEPLSESRVAHRGQLDPNSCSRSRWVLHQHPGFNTTPFQTNAATGIEVMA